MKVNFKKIDEYANSVETLIYAHAFHSITMANLLTKIKESPQHYKKDVLIKYLISLRESPLAALKDGDKELIDEYLKGSS